MSSAGPYDKSIDSIESVQMHNAGKDKDFGVEVADGIHETRTSTEIERRKEQFKR